MNDAWSEWRDHDGGDYKGNPSDIVQAVDLDGDKYEVEADLLEWPWIDPDDPEFSTGGNIIRYRVRKPRALLQLIEMVENLPAPAQPRVDA